MPDVQATGESLPNFLIIGQAKCATSSLHYYLSQHPQFWMSKKKECHFFCHEDIDTANYLPQYHPVDTVEGYQEQFAGGHDRPFRGESSPMYMYYTGAAERISKMIPGCKLIAVVRHPVDRAFSAYTHARRDGLEPLAFPDGIAAEKERMSDGNHTPLQAYIDCGLYAKKLRPYFDAFDRNQIKVVVYEDLKHDLPGTLREICRFLGADETFPFKIKPQLNRSGLPRRQWLHRMTQAAATDRFPFNVIKIPFSNSAWVRTVKGIEFWNYEKLRLEPAERIKWLKLFESDMDELSEMIGRDMRAIWELEGDAHSRTSSRQTFDSEVVTHSR